MGDTTIVEYTAGELVTLARLKKIEREHKSLGSTLDKRILYKIEDPKFPTNREDRINNRRAGVVSTQLENNYQNNHGHLYNHNINNNDIPIIRKESDASQLSELEKIQLIVNSKIAEDFENEELIWKTKSNSANYSIKRKFHNPELQEFLDNFTTSEKEKFYKKCKERVIKISIKLRKEINNLKSDMNESGMFHPDANTHRAHCLYLTKLFKA